MRKKRVYKKHYKGDALHGRVDLGRLVNYIMRDGKKSVAETQVYKALERVKELTKEDAVLVFERAIANVSPMLEVASRRVGGANYQVPREVSPARKFILALRWVVNAAKSRKGKSISEKLADEIIAAAKNEGTAIKKKQDTHRMAEANRAFAHFAK